MSKVSSTVRVGSGAFWSLAGQIVSAAGSMLVAVIAARLLGPSAKGTLSIIQQFVAILVILFGFGIGTANVYFIASGRVKPGHAVGNSFVLLLLTSVISFGALLAFFMLSNLGFSIPLILVASGSFTATSAVILFSGVRMGIEGNRRPATSGIISASTSLISVVVIAFSGHLSVTSVLVATLIGSIIGVAYLLWPLWAIRSDITFDFPSFKAMFDYASKGYLAELAGYVHLRLDILVIGMILGTASAGIFSVGVSFAELIWFIPGALGNAIISAASRLHQSEKREVSAFSSRISTALVLITGLLMCGVVPIAIPILFGSAFKVSVFVFFALIPGAIADGLLRVTNNYALSMGIVCWKEQIVGLMINAVLVYFAAHNLGIVAVALSSTISYSTVLLLIARRLRRQGLLSGSEFYLLRQSDVGWALQSASTYLGRFAPRQR